MQSLSTAVSTPGLLSLCVLSLPFICRNTSQVTRSIAHLQLLCTSGYACVFYRSLCRDIQPVTDLLHDGLAGSKQSSRLRSCVFIAVRNGYKYDLSD
jgi:hypothetical protein